jgi:cytochrome c-type biogenesis protein
MALDVGYVSAIGAGALSFLSPCVLPLVPPYLCYMAGVSVEDFRGEGARAEDRGTRYALIGASVAFVLGFSTVFVALGAGASTIGGLLRAWQQELAVVAGLLIILMGLNFLGVIRIPFLSREARFQSGGKPASGVAAYFMGLAFAFGWTPCIGPVLAMILTLAATEQDVMKGAGLLAVYSAGLGIPFMLAAAGVGTFLGFLKRFRKHMLTVERVMGVLLILTGIMFLTGTLQDLSYWLIEQFPWLGTIG